MKSEIYNALAALNRGFDVALESLKILDAEGVTSADYVQQQTEKAEELRAGMNHYILNKLEIRELADLDHYGQMRRATEAQLRKNSPQ